MSQTRFTKIISTSAYLPKKILTNEEIAEKVDTSHTWIVERTGIHQRHIADEKETTTSMAVEAAKAALEKANCLPNDLDMIIVATSTPDFFFPSTACLVQKALGIDRPVIAFDQLAACAGFVYALNTANAFIQTGSVQRALVIGADLLSRVVDWTDRRTCVLFGDGAGACLLGVDSKPGWHYGYLAGQGRYANSLMLPNPNSHVGAEFVQTYLYMEGSAVYKVAVQVLEDAIKTALEASQLTVESIDWFIPHQANQRIVEFVAGKLNIPLNKMVLTLKDHGNTSAASIPLALNTAVMDGRIQPGHRLLIEGMGGGMVWGACLITY